MAPSNRVEKFRDPAKLTQKISWPTESPPARGDFSLCPLPNWETGKSPNFPKYYGIKKDKCREYH